MPQHQKLASRFNVKSPSVPEGSITIINTCPEQPIACKVNGVNKLLPTQRGKLVVEPVSGKKVAHVVMMSKYSVRDKYSKEAPPFLDQFFRTNDGSRKVILAYSVSRKESSRGAKYVRSSLDF